MPTIVWSDYLKYRSEQRGFELSQLEEILKYADERYYDNETGRYVVVGRHQTQLVVIPYESSGDVVTPITIHATTRQQIKFRLRIGRYTPYGFF
ncbi:hypothetical protein [Synechocystis sp. CACIAM 05]|uniref:hypothetical protein n=1 Tax=Synechocystis sp. CACIAM 05 TaxID=1933929 RepID=UPI00138E58C2|nr:hypothetical protein [Synechocystis sp. CACIAM 05]QHU99076.1 hypothetical protein BWK47_02325 [Synechocystis sp. CACIAM 05]